MPSQPDEADNGTDRYEQIPHTQILNNPQVVLDSTVSVYASGHALQNDLQLLPDRTTATERVAILTPPGG
jgi:hypothetical protein